MNKKQEIPGQLQNTIFEAVKKKASDLHLSEGRGSAVRCNGKLFTLDVPGLSSAIFQEIEARLLSKEKREEYQVTGSVDFRLSMQSEEAAKHIVCRCHLFRYNSGQQALAIRFLPLMVPACEALSIPWPVCALTQKEQGLVIVSGPTGSGKTTTIAALLDEINQKSGGHIITIEDPIEYTLREKKAIIHQREIGADCVDFIGGLRAALREDPDVLLVGEMRDQETVSTALAAAETGHLVFSTLHTGTVAEALDRLIQYFPPENHAQIQSELAISFQGIIVQKLFPCTKGGRVAAFEILLPTDATRNLIRKGEFYKLTDYMPTASGMQTMAQALEGLRKKGVACVR